MSERVQVRSLLTGEVVTGAVVGARGNAIIYVGFGDNRIWIPAPHPRYSHCEPFMLFSRNRLVRTAERSYEANDWELLFLGPVTPAN